MVVALGTDATEGAGPVGEVSVVRGAAATMEAGAAAAAAAAAAQAETWVAAGAGCQGPGQCSDAVHLQHLGTDDLALLSMDVATRWLAAAGGSEA